MVYSHLVLSYCAHPLLHAAAATLLLKYNTQEAYIYGKHTEALPGAGLRVHGTSDIAQLTFSDTAFGNT
jgi:hypothetical protein